ncbi:EamA family transporter, partial [Candidatus Kaiserbacteria bacterium]|nr:EamA family transporter [Candidatus Kaiserbacteria bacterium]
IPFAMFTNGVWSDVLYVLPIAILSAILSEAFVFFATARGDTIITGVLFSTYPIFTIFFAYLFLQERLLFWAWIALGLVVVGVLIVSSPSKREWVKDRIAHWQFHLIVWPLVAAVAVSISDVAGKHIIDQTSAGTFLIALAIAEVPVGIVFLRMQKQSLRQLKTFFSRFAEHKYAFLSGLLSTLAVLMLWLAFEILPASVASPLTAVTPIFVFILGVTFLKEKVTFKNTLGLIIVTTGILLLSLKGL